MMLRALPILTVLFAGCTFLLDPEVCADQSDCDSKQVCEDGVCIGPADEVVEAEAGADANSDATGDADAEQSFDRPVIRDVEQADAPADAGEADGASDGTSPDDVPQGGIAPTCEIRRPAASPDPIGDPEPEVEIVVSDDHSEALLTVTFAGEPITIDPATNTYLGVVAIEEGENLLRLDATDQDGLSCFAERLVVGDFTDPVVVLFENVDEPIVHNQEVKRVGGRVEDAHFTGRLLAVELNGEAIDAEIAWDGDEFQFPIELQSGDNEVAIVATDDAGNESEPLVFTVVFDDELPEVIITSPVEGPPVLDRRVVIEGRVTKGGAPLAGARIDAVARQGRDENVLRPSARTQQDGSFRTEELSLFVGQNTIEVRARDNVSGNVGVASVDVERQNPEPCVAFDDDLVLLTDEDTIQLAGTYCPAVESVSIVVAGGEPTPAVTVEADLRWSAEIVLPAPGVYEIAAIARGGEAEARASVEAAWDDTRPAVAITRPDDQDCVNAERVQVCGRANDPESGVVRVLVNGIETEVDVSGNFCHDTPLSAGADRFVRARAVNGAGAFRDAEIQLDVDREAPVVTVASPPNAWLGVDRNGRVHLRGTVDSGVCGLTRLTIDGGQVGLNGAAFDYPLELPEGDHFVALVTRDRAGNDGQANYAFRIDSTDPVIETLLPEDTVITPEPQLEVGARACDARSGVAVARVDGVDVEPVFDGECATFTRVIAVPEGITRVPIYVEDLVGRAAESEIVVSRDVTGPVVVVTHPQEDADVSSSAVVEGTVEDGEFGSGVATVTVNGVEAVIDLENGTWRASGVELDAAGAHTLTVVGTDNAGNVTDPAVERRVRVLGYHVRTSATDGLVVATNVAWVGVADTNGDDRLDIVAVAADPDSLSAVYLQQEDGTFDAIDDPGLPTEAALHSGGFGDFDADGRTDVLVVGNNRNGVFRGVGGSGDFETVPMSGVPNGMNATGLALGDIDRDGALDALALAGAGTRLLLGDGNATFQRQPHADLGLGGVSEAAAGVFVDVNDDGVLDLVAVGDAASALWIGDRAGQFAEQDAAVFPNHEARFVVPIDANRDGSIDLLTAGQGARFYLNDGAGDLSNVDTLGLEWTAGEDVGAVVADLDGDARDDLVVYGSGGPKFWRNTAQGFVALQLGLDGVPGDIGALTSAAAADIDGDGDSDIVVGGPAGVRIIRSNRGTIDDGYRYVHLDILRAVEEENVIVGPRDAVGALLFQDLDGDLAADRVVVPAAVGPTLLTLGGRDLADATVKYVDKGAAGDRFRDVVELPAGERINVLARE